MSQPESSGLIVSLAEPIIDRIFHHRGTYVHSSSDPSKFLKAGDRVFFYDTLSSNLIGEAVVARLTLDGWDSLGRYRHNLFLSPEELEQYARENGMRKDEPMLVLELQEAIKYMNPIRCPVPIPSSGLQVTREVFNKITSANR